MKNINHQPLKKAKALAVLLKLSDEKKSIDFDAESISELWAIDKLTEDDLYYLNESGAIYFEMIGEDGFKPIIMCSITEQTYTHLLNCLAQISGEKNLLEDRVKQILNHDPARLMKEVDESKKHIAEAKQKISENELLKPLQKPLDDIESHFNSVSKVAKNYDDVYKNILKPVQEESKRGVRTTVKWAVASILVSVVIANLEIVKGLFSQAFFAMTGG